MEGQLPIGVGAYDSLHVSMFWMFPGGWTVRVHARRSGASWEDTVPAVYDHLSTEEAVQVVEDEVAARLG